MITEITAKSLFRKYKRIESWFLCRYGMNLYRGCGHNCAYCDGRAEGYYVDGEFGRDIAVKANAIELLRRELDPSRRRKPVAGGYVAIGGGVGDTYQPAEKTYCLASRVLKLLLQYRRPVHILTKSTLVQRDIDIISRINDVSRAMVSFSFSSVDDRISAVFEPGVPPPAERLAALAAFKKRGIACGMYLMPVIPFVTDLVDKMEASVKAAADAGLDFVVFGGMTLKDGRQRQHFMRVLERHFPDTAHQYDIIYRGDRYGQAHPEYYEAVNQAFVSLAAKYRMPMRIPSRLYADLLNDNDLVTVMLEHLDYLYKQRGYRSPFGLAAWSISQLKEPLSTMELGLGRIKGVGERCRKVVREILETRRCGELEEML
ncbi:MAG: radical SAM protein [Chitinivibrionales bacterium]|nr:radical SAM protein [Chitinivibrionales bacterium]MBD3395160.1 radical SAM protein [Chitinivibrionales bacterium]